MLLATLCGAYVIFWGFLLQNPIQVIFGFAILATVYVIQWGSDWDGEE